MARNTPNPVQQYRGTTAQHANYAGAAGEITVDTTKKTVVVQDGVTKGGTPLAKESVKIKAGESITVTGGTLAGDNTIAAKIGSKAQRGVLQVGDNIEVSNGLISTLDWTAEVEELNAANATALSDAMYDAGFVNVTGENTSVVGRAIGELVWTLLPVRAAGFQLLDGSLIYSTGIYAAFYNYMVQLKNTGEHDNLFVTETAWQQSVTQYGVCGKFVLDTTAGTVRIPKVTGHVEGTIDKNAVGDLIEAGLPNITGQVLIDAPTSAHSGCFTRSGGNYHTYSATSTSGSSVLDMDASLSNPIYRDDINTVQTQSIKGYMYIIVGTYAKSDLQVNIDNVATDVRQAVTIAQEAYDKAGMVELKGTRTTTGDWTITGLTVGKPLFITLDASELSGTLNPGAVFEVLSGSYDGLNGSSIYGTCHLGRIYASGVYWTGSCGTIIIPTDTTVVIELGTLTTGCKMRAYQ